MPRPILVPSPTGTASTWQIGTYNAVSDTFTSVLDLNDRVTWFVKSYDLPQPEKVVSRSGNPRTNGERITNERYKNRYITLTLQLRSTTTLAAIDTAIHSLEAAIDNTPFMLRLAEAQAAQYSYAIVKSWVHNIPQDPLQRLAKVKTGITIIFECEPGLLGDKLYLDNLVVNPGFEAPSGPAVTVFNDSFATTNAYTLSTGSAPTLASNVMTIPASTRVLFGSPAWGAYNLWQIRFQWVTSLSADFYLHFINTSNFLRVNVQGTSITLRQTIAGTNNTLASAAPTLTTGTFYWLQVTQFPTVPGSAPYVQATLFNDSAGAIGTAVTNGAVGPVATADAVTALAGVAGLQANGAALAVGGNFANVHTVSLFGPGGWLFVGTSGTGPASGGWEQSTSNTYPNGPVTSYGAARIECPPAGTVDAQWLTYNGGTIAGSNASPVATAGDVLGFSAMYKSSAGLGASAQVRIVISEYNSSGTFLRNATAATMTGPATSWMQLSGTYTTGANCAYVALSCRVTDTGTPGTSANATVWFDNVQLWDQTALNGQTTMPYCELRFPQAPAQLLVSGLVGDLPVPATLAFGTYIGNSGSTVYDFLIGRRAYATSGPQLVAALTYTDSTSTAVVPVLDSTSYGGCTLKWTSAASNDTFLPVLFSGRPADYQGNWALLLRMASSETSGTNIGKVSITTFAVTQNGAWNQSTVWYDSYGTAALTGLTTQNAWKLLNAGVFPMPPFARSQATDLTQNYQAVSVTLADTNTAPTAMSLNWFALVPNEGNLVRGQIQYVGGAVVNTFNSWNWYYLDASQSNMGLVPITGSSNETTALANIAHATGGAGVPPSNSPNGATAVIPTGNAFLTLDPTPPTNARSVSGVNQLVGILSDGLTDGTRMATPFYASLSYTPQYLDPR